MSRAMAATHPHTVLGAAWAMLQPAADAQGQQSQMQGAGAGIHAGGVRNSAIGSELLLEIGHGRAQGESAGFQDAADGGIDFGFDA